MKRFTRICERKGQGNHKATYRLVKVDLEVLIDDIIVRPELRPNTIETHILRNGSRSCLAGILWGCVARNS